MPKPFKFLAPFYCLLALVYLWCAPTTVQNLDSGEMVANSYGLFVIHPPGYPLFTWLLSLITHIPFSTVFFRASVFTIICSLASLVLVARLALGARTHASALVGALALSLSLALTPVFWRYSILPDVFMLHLLFCLLLIDLYVAQPPSQSRLWKMTLIFALASAHHQTVLFCAPMLIHAAVQSWHIHRSVMKATGPLITGALLTGLLYASLLLLHTDSLHSWGHLQTLSDVWSHFLREDFGTFQISGHHASHFSWEPLKTFTLEILQANPAVLALLGFMLWSLFKARTLRAQHTSLIVVMFCFLLSIFALIPFADLDQGLTVERFFLMPLTLGIGLSAAVWRGLEISRGKALIFSLGILLISIFHLAMQTGQLDYSHDTLIEDYAQNLLRMVDGKAKSILVTSGDTRLFAIRYVQVVKALSPQTLSIPLGMAFSEPQLEKIQRQHPDFHVGAGWQTGANARSLTDYLLKPNLQAYETLTSLRINEPGMKTVFMGLGRKLAPGQGDTVDASSLVLIKRRTEMTGAKPSLVPDEKRDLFSEYAFAYLKLGMKATNSHEQIQYFEAALKVVPYCWPALANICVINEKTTHTVDHECRARLKAMKESEFNYY